MNIYSVYAQLHNLTYAIICRPNAYVYMHSLFSFSLLWLRIACLYDFGCNTFSAGLRSFSEMWQSALVSPPERHLATNGRRRLATVDGNDGALGYNTDLWFSSRKRKNQTAPGTNRTGLVRGIGINKIWYSKIGYTARPKHTDLRANIT